MQNTGDYKTSWLNASLIEKSLFIGYIAFCIVIIYLAIPFI